MNKFWGAHRMEANVTLMYVVIRPSLVPLADTHVPQRLGGGLLSTIFVGLFFYSNQI
jgi:hypothetical protein